MEAPHSRGLGESGRIVRANVVGPCMPKLDLPPRALPTLAESRLARRIVLCALYCAQGMPWGFVTITLVAYVSAQGATLEEVGDILALATLPWSFKLVWALVIDRFTYRPMGRRRPWILLAQLAMGITLLAMILDGETSVDTRHLAWMVFLHNCFVSLQDVGSDALAVDILDDEERGRVNGMMWASSYVGIAIGGAGMGTVLARFGVQTAFVLQGMVLFSILCLPLFLRERRGEKFLPWTRGESVRVGNETQITSVRALAGGLAQAFRNRAPLRGLFYALSCQVMVGMFVATNPVYFVQKLGWSQEDYSQLSGALGAGAGVLGALVGGFLVDRIGVRRQVLVTAVLISSLCFSVGHSPWLSTSTAAASLFLMCTEFLMAAQVVATFSLFMRLCSPAVAATQFTLYMAATNLTRAQSAKIGSVLEGFGYGFGAIYIAMAIAMLVSLPLLFTIPIPSKVRTAPS